MHYLDQQTNTWLFRLLAIFAAGTSAHILRDRSLLSDACAWVPLATTALQLILGPGLHLHKRTSRLATVFMVPLLFRLYYVLTFLKLMPWTPLAHKLVSRGGQSIQAWCHLPRPAFLHHLDVEHTVFLPTEAIQGINVFWAVSALFCAGLPLTLREQAVLRLGLDSAYYLFLTTICHRHGYNLMPFQRVAYDMVAGAVAGFVTEMSR